MKPPLIGLGLLSIACMHPLPTRQQPLPFQTNAAVYGEFGPLSISMGCALHPVLTVSPVTFMFCPFSWLLALAGVSVSALGQQSKTQTCVF